MWPASPSTRTTTLRPTCSRCRDRDEAVAVVRALLGLRGIDVPPLEDKAEPDDDGWIRWKGGECPVDPHTSVAVHYRKEADGENEAYQAHLYRWSHAPEGQPSRDWDIIAYRLVD